MTTARTSGRRAAEIFRADADGAAVVVDDDAHLLGVLTRDELPTEAEGRGRARLRLRHRSTVNDLLSGSAVVVDGRAAVTQAAQLAHDAGVQHLVVVDPEGRVAGLVSRRALFRVYGRPDGLVEEDIRTRVLDRLFRLRPDALNVSVREGVVTLSGRVEQQAMRANLVAAVRLVAGVGAVDDALTVRPRSAPARPHPALPHPAARHPAPRPGPRRTTVPAPAVDRGNRAPAPGRVSAAPGLAV